MKLLLCLVFAVIATKGEDEILKEFVNNNLHFTADVYKEILKSYLDDFLVFPLSAQTILALVLSGATGNTAKQLSTALHLPQNDEKIRNIFTTLSAVLQDNTRESLITANKIYIKEGIQIKDEFKNIAVNTFTSEIQNTDFSNSQETADGMNKWVEENTHDKIKDLISTSWGEPFYWLDDDASMVLFTAVYFKGTWLSPFTYTVRFPFNINKYRQVHVDIMSQTGTFGYYESSALKAKFLEMDYDDHHSSMIIILPDDIDGLQTLEESHIADILATPKFRSQRVTVHIPKFKIESAVEFKPILLNLGVKDAFIHNATFNKISEETVLISKIIQKTFIEVEEKGTTTAAATYAVLQPLNEFSILGFNAYHPFIYIIKSHGLVLVMGSYKGE